MTENIITNAEAAKAVVTMVKNQIKNESGKYATYVAENNVTVENVADHVKALREMAYPGVKASGRAEQGTPEREAKKFADKVRLGLRHTIGDTPAARAGTENLLTTHGIEALEGATPEEFLKLIMAEWDSRRSAQ